jgi:hypothetical protein
MDTITLTYNGKTKHHVVYTRAEADEQGIRYKPWRKARTGEWALTDDGFVAQCLHVKVYEDKRGSVRTLHVFPFWNQWNSANAVLSYRGACARRNMNPTGRSAEAIAEIWRRELAPEEAEEMRRKALEVLNANHPWPAELLDRLLAGKLFRH